MALEIFAPRIAKSTILALAFAVLLTTTVEAASKYRDSGEFITELANRAIELLASKTATDEEQETRFRQLLREGFAVERIGIFVLGKYRRSASDQEITEFLNLFEDYIVTLYSSAFQHYSGQTFVVARVVKTRSPRDTMVVAHINPDDPEGPAKVVFQVRNSSGEFKILDVKIQGISMIVTQRDEFTGFIRNNGGKVAPLIEALHKKTTSLKTRADNTK